MSSASQGSGPKEVLKGVAILVLLVVGAGFGGYFYGTYQKFAPIQNVAPGTPGAIEHAPASTATTSSSTATVSSSSSSLKKKYWIHCSGDQHVGYAITVFVNGQLADKFFAPGRDVDITNWVKPGENQVTFQSSVLPESMNEHNGQDNYYLTLSIVNGQTIVPNPSESDVLLNYKRTSHEASDNKAFNDTLTFLTME